MFLERPDNFSGPKSFMFAVFALKIKVSTNFESDTIKLSGAPNENIVQNHLNIALLNVF